MSNYIIQISSDAHDTTWKTIVFCVFQRKKTRKNVKNVRRWDFRFFPFPLERKKNVKLGKSGGSTGRQT